MPRRVIVSTGLFVFSIILIISIIPIRNYIDKKLGINNAYEVVDIFDSNITCDNLSPIGYHLVDAYNCWENTRPVTLTEKDKKEIRDWFESKKENLPDNKYKAIFKGKNLIVIQVESLENFVINQKINGQEITPNLNRLLKNSIYFSNICEQVNNGMSSDADLMTNTSIYPIRAGSTFFRYPLTQYSHSLPKLLRKKGYQTVAYHPDKGSFWNWMPALKSIGFEKCVDSSSYNLSDSIGLGISDASYLKQIEPMIAKQRQPFFSFVVTLTSHMPFNLPNNLRDLKLDTELDKSYLGGYFQSIHYTDKYLGAFIENLNRDKLLDNTVVVIYGDHEGIHRFYPEDVKNARPSLKWWLDNQKKTPLIFYQNHYFEEDPDTIGGEIDILPTICYLLGVDESNYTNSAMGRNLLKTKKSFVVLENKKVVSANLKENEKNQAIKGLDLADKIIRSNYFKNY
ncbi:MAG: LTA synthase family protein [Bacillota bacterium]|nr:LTA synthase family protein [Bacillota bacterium]